MAAELDPRCNPFRSDIAAEKLKSLVQAERFVEPSTFLVTTPVVDLFAKPQSTSLASQLLYGELFDVYEVSGEWAWGQNRTDGYVGYVMRSALDDVFSTSHRVTALRAHVYPSPDFKGTPQVALPYQAHISVSGETNGFSEMPQGFVSNRHLSGEASDFVAEAGRMLGVPYLWGGRSPLGLDCSALVQLALMATGVDCPRDSDMQMRELGDRVDGPFRRGDLVFWTGHVGIMFDEATLLHANVHHMCVAFEPIDDAIMRIEKSDGPILSHKRL